MPQGRWVISLYGSEDGVLNREKYRQYQINLPRDAVEKVLEGGNHSGFGSYGHQEGDGEASVSAAEQTAEAAACLAEFFLDGQ